MKFHTIHIDLQGNCTPLEHLSTVTPDSDIADELARISRLLGVEGSIDEFSGLWFTHYRYDDFSSLSGNFLKRGLRVSVACPASAPLPVIPLFCTLQIILDGLSSGNLSEVKVVIETNSIRLFQKRREIHPKMPAVIRELFSNQPHTKGIFRTVTIDEPTSPQPISYPLSQERIDLRTIGSIIAFLWSQNKHKWNQQSHSICIIFA